MKPGEYRREILLVPFKGSPRSEQWIYSDREGYERLIATPCIFCKKPLEGGWTYLYHPHEQYAHLGCADDFIAKEKADRENPWLIDEGARLAQLTQEGFKLLPSWEKDRWIRQVLESRKNDPTFTKSSDNPGKP